MNKLWQSVSSVIHESDHHGSCQLLRDDPSTSGHARGPNNTTRTAQLRDRFSRDWQETLYVCSTRDSVNAWKRKQPNNTQTVPVGRCDSVSLSAGRSRVTPRDAARSTPSNQICLQLPVRRNEDLQETPNAPIGRTNRKHCHVCALPVTPTSSSTAAQSSQCRNLRPWLEMLKHWKRSSSWLASSFFCQKSGLRAVMTCRYRSTLLCGFVRFGGCSMDDTGIHFVDNYPTLQMRVE